MKNFIKEFKEFISRGNVLDMAVGVIIATAFGKITSSLVSDVISPLLAYLFNSPNTDALNITLRAADEEAGVEAIVLGLGTFVGAIVDFVVIAFVVFCIIKAFNKARALTEKKKEEAAAVEEAPAEPEPTKEEVLLTEIRDLLKAQK